MNTKKHLHKLGRTKAHRKAMKSNLLTSLVLYEHVTTTKAKAKAVIPMFSTMIAKAKEPKHLSSRYLNSLLNDDFAIKKVEEVYLSRFKEQTSGFISIYKLSNRKGDNADMVKLIVKGYKYKEIGKKSAPSKSKETEKPVESKKSKTDVNQKNQTLKTSQVATQSPNQVRSRSGI